ncbi:efflux RND transporter periplasmic adaptor subunit [Anthocerotibacter panamensis]|uniref:efflux RND transporter periplasmic adaptor subunit n=1 Tax=Anthocerotibacter panamensis TaxID=2857077 RepID=UPI001C402C69|nr:efflux RND transporter periplasmic adaptor subunit [Anthocerotibacter panamensis]
MKSLACSLLSLLALGLLSACSQEVKIPEVPAEAALADPGPTRIPLKPEQAKEIGLTLAKAEIRNFPVTVQATGEVKAAEDRVVHVSTPAPGRVTAVAVQLGQSVHSGQTLAVLKSDSVGQIQTDLLEAVLQLDSDLKQAQLQTNFSKAAFEREEKLFADRISARADLEAARTQYAKDQGTISALQAKRSATITAAQERLSLFGVAFGVAGRVVRERHIDPYITITAPRSGIVVSRLINIGELADPSKELFQLADLGQVWLEADLYEKDIPKVHQGQPVTLTLDSLDGRHFPGRISYLGSELDPQNRTLPIRAVVPNPQFMLKPSMFARAEIQVADSPELSVPRSALQKSGDFTFAYVPVAPNLYEERKITPGIDDGQFVQVLGGLQPQEKVVSQGTLALKGEALKISGGIK